MEVAAAESDGSLHLVEYQSKSSNHRHHLLSSWGIAFLTIAYGAYRRVEDWHGPLRSLVQKLGLLASPVAFTMLYQWLTILSFADEQILAIEDVAGCLFPRSAFIFDKIHMLSEISETLVEKLDCIIDYFPMIVASGLPFLNWATAHLSVGLDFLMSKLMDWDTSCGKEARGLIMDTGFLDHSSKTPVEDPKGPYQFERQYTIEKMTIFSEPQQPETKTGSTDKHFADYHDHINKKPIFSDNKNSENKARVTKAVGTTDHHHMEKSLFFRDVRHANTRVVIKKELELRELDAVEKFTILDDAKHAQKDMEVTKKSHDNDNKKPVERVQEEFLPAAEKIAKKESDNHRVPTLEAMQKAGKCSTDHKEATAKDDLLLDLFEFGWHSKRSGRRGS